MVSSFLLLVAIFALTAVEAENKKKYAMIGKYGLDFDSEIERGCLSEANKTDVECVFIHPPDIKEITPWTWLQAKKFQNEIVQQVIRNQTMYAGVGISVIEEDQGVQNLNDLKSKTNLTVVTFDSDVRDESLRKLYVGPDNTEIGQVMARLLLQLYPNGGEYTILTQNDTNLNLRTNGIIETLKPDDWNLKETRFTSFDAVVDDFYDVVGCPNGRIDSTSCENNTEASEAIFSVAPWPMTDGNQKDMRIFFRKYPKVAVIIAHATSTQLKLFFENFGSGLVGQFPFDIGSNTIKALNDLSEEKDTESETYKTPLLQVYHVTAVAVLDENQNLVGDLYYIAVACFIISLFCCISCAVWTYMNRRERVVKASQPMFLYIITLGALILSSSVLLFGVEPKSVPSNNMANDSNTTNYEKADWQDAANAACWSRYWLVSLGFTIMFSALFSKMWKINKIFKAATKLKRVNIRKRDVLLPMFILLGINLSIFLTWVIPTDFRLEYSRRSMSGTDIWNRVNESYGACHAPKSGSEPYFYAVVFVSVMVPLIMALREAYKARKVQTEFGESWYIRVAFAFLIQMMCVGAPVAILTYNTPKLFYGMCVLIIFIITLIILALMFIPKIKALRQLRRSEGRTRPNSAHSESMEEDDNGLGASFIVEESTHGGPLEQPDDSGDDENGDDDHWTPDEGTSENTEALIADLEEYRNTLVHKFRLLNNKTRQGETDEKDLYKDLAEWHLQMKRIVQARLKTTAESVRSTQDTAYEAGTEC